MRDLLEIWRFVKKYFFKYKVRVIFYVIIAILFGLTTMGLPYILGSFIDKLLVNKSIRFIVIYCTLFILINLFKMVSMYFVKTKGTSLNIDMSVAFKRDILSHVQRLSLTHTNQKDKSAYTYRINNDAEYLVIFLLNFLQSVTKNVLYIVIPLVYLLKIDMILFCVAMLMLPVIYLLAKYYSGKLFTAYLNRQNALNVFFEKLEEQLFNHKYTKLNYAEPILDERLVEASKTLRKTSIKDEQVSFSYEVVSSNMDIFLKIFLSIYGGVSVLNGKMTVGEFVIISTFLSLITQGFAYFLSLGQEIQTHKAFYVRLKEITDIPIENYGSFRPDKITNINVSNLKFGYEEKDIISDFNFEFTKGNIYTVVGENGSGKSTLIGLLLGLYIDEHNGEISYDGKSIHELDMSWIRKNLIGVSEQEPGLLNDTIGFNITYSKDRDENKLKEVINAVLLNEYLEETEQGLDTLINANSTNLSGGQKQKISIAKALYKNPDILVLDEPTSALDAKSKELFISYLVQIKSDKIIIVITHDQSFLDISDEVVNLGQQLIKETETSHM